MPHFSSLQVTQLNFQKNLKFSWKAPKEMFECCSLDLPDGGHSYLRHTHPLVLPLRRKKTHLKSTPAVLHWQPPLPSPSFSLRYTLTSITPSFSSHSHFSFQPAPQQKKQRMQDHFPSLPRQTDEARRVKRFPEHPLQKLQRPNKGKICAYQILTPIH